jgi:hypothetical protein
MATEPETILTSEDTSPVTSAADEAMPESVVPDADDAAPKSVVPDADDAELDPAAPIESEETPEPGTLMADDTMPDPVTPVADDEDLAPVAPIASKRKRSWQRVALIVLIIVIVLGSGSGVAAFVVSATRPQPSIRLVSVYALGSTPVGATDTTFQVSGQNFASHTTVTFLLDGKTAPGNVSRQSDSQGKVVSTLTITAAWLVGKHTLTARDASGSATARSVSILIVPAGADKTPGPNGAPTDSVSGTITATITPTVPATSDPSSIFISLAALPMTKSLVVSAGADGGKVCAKEDDGKPHPGSPNGSGIISMPVQPPPGSTYKPGGSPPSQFVPVPGGPGAVQFVPAPGGPGNETETFSATCSGTYRGGHLTYTETITSDTTVTTFQLPGLSNVSMTCTLKSPYVAMQLNGTFTSPTSISGTYTSQAHTTHCDGSSGVSFGFVDPSTGKLTPLQDRQSAAQTGKWQGLASMRDPNAPVTPGALAAAGTCFLDPAGASVPAVYAGSATPTAGPATAPRLRGTAVPLKDGLKYADIKAGSGPTVTSSSTVTVNYTGWLASTCQKFDSSYDGHSSPSGQTQSPRPFTVQLGNGEVIAGWEEGLVGMKAGGIRRLYIPAALAYGAQGTGPIPPNADLIFDVQVVSVA